MQSVWSATTEFNIQEENPLPKRTDVLVIGGGIAGLLCAFQLQNAGIECIVAEADRVCSKTTKNTTGKITSQHGLIYNSLIRRFGVFKAEGYLMSNEASAEEYRKLCTKINCDFEAKDSYVYSRNDRSKLEKELDALGKLGKNACFAEKLQLPFYVSGAVKFENQGQFNPLKFLKHISEELNICERTRVFEVDGHYARTEKGDIYADRIIAATHFPFINTHGGYFLKLYQNRSYVIAFENAPDCNGMYVDENDTGLSFRNYRNMLLIGGGSHRTGKKSSAWRDISAFARVYYPEARECMRWAAQDCMSLDEVPYIGQYSKNTPELLVAAGFNKWGMTGAMTAAMILRDIVLGVKNEYAEVFSPDRSIIRPQLAVNGFETAVSLLTPIKKRCPHLGCALKWNKHEHSWDCPCHGSRFDEKGELLDNPATGDLKHR